MFKMWKQINKIPIIKNKTIKVHRKLYKPKFNFKGLQKLVKQKLIDIKEISVIKIKLKILKIYAGSQGKRNKSNKIIKSINGNIRGMKVMSWNKTDRPLEDKIAEIKFCLDPLMVKP